MRFNIDDKKKNQTKISFHSTPGESRKKKQKTRDLTLFFSTHQHTEKGRNLLLKNWHQKNISQFYYCYYYTFYGSNTTENGGNSFLCFMSRSELTGQRSRKEPTRTGKFVCAANGVNVYRTCCAPGKNAFLSGYTKGALAGVLNLPGYRGCCPRNRLVRSIP